MKPCRKCGGLNRNASGACRPCKKAAQERSRTIEQRREYGRNYYLAHQDKMRADSARRSSEYRKNNPRAAWLEQAKRIYGLLPEQWDLMLVAQSGRCACCSAPLAGRFAVDHEHVDGYSAMPASEKVKYVRGLVCWCCNRFRIASNTAANIDEVCCYLKSHAATLAQKA